MSDRDRSRSRSRSPIRGNSSPGESKPSDNYDSAPPANGNGNGGYSNGDGAGAGGESVKLYIGNIDYGTDDVRLRETFQKYGTITDAFVPTERGTNRPRGFGFVTFSTRAEAEDAMRALDGTDLDGRTIRISESKPREKVSGPFNPSGASDVKLFVGNLSFDTVTGTIRDLFEGVGEVSDCYMPTDKQTGRPRGFAFVTMPAALAQEAMKKLTGEVLDGRAIRIEEAGGKKSSRDDFRGGGYGGGGGGYGGDRGYDRGYGGDRGYDRDRGGYDRGYDRGYGGRDDRGYDRGRGRDYDRDYEDRGRGRDDDRDGRSYDRDDRRGGRDDRRRDYDRDDRRRDYDRDDRGRGRDY